MALSYENAALLAKALEDQLDKRAKDVTRWNDYYNGEQNLLFASERFRQAFGGLFDAFSDNWCGPVVDAAAERLGVLGFRVGDGSGGLPEEADKDATRIMQRNDLQSWLKVAFLEAAVKSRSYALVWADDPDAENPQPEITIEDAAQVIIAYDAGNRRRRKAAIKRWVEDNGDQMVTLYTPEQLWKFRRRGVAGNSQLYVPPAYRRAIAGLEPRGGDEDVDVVDNPLGTVPIVELPNTQRLLDPPAPEHKRVIPLQDAVNKLLADMMVAAEAGAFPARWGTGIDLPKDPKTGQEIDDPDLWRMSLSKLLRASNPQARFGNFDATDLSNFVTGVEMVVGHIAALTFTPPHYILAKMVNISGDALVAAEAGLSSKSRNKTQVLDNPLPEMMRLAFGVLGDPRQDAVAISPIWADVEYRSDAQLADALLKKKQIGVPWRQLMEDAHYTPQQIERMVQWREEEARLAGIGLGVELDVGAVREPQDDGTEPASV